MNQCHAIINGKYWLNRVVFNAGVVIKEFVLVCFSFRTEGVQVLDPYPYDQLNVDYETTSSEIVNGQRCSQSNNSIPNDLCTSTVNISCKCFFTKSDLLNPTIFQDLAFGNLSWKCKANPLSMICQFNSIM